MSHVLNYLQSSLKFMREPIKFTRSENDRMFMDGFIKELINGFYNGNNQYRYRNF